MRIKRWIQNGWGHLCTISQHKWQVMKNCFRVGLYKQGLLHDLSKYSPTEFVTGIRYYQGNRSPNSAEREEKGYSSAWLHHKGRNRHHFEYWLDVVKKQEGSVYAAEMPVKYVMEMVMDRIAASKVYEKENYTDWSAWEYYTKKKDSTFLHPNTRALLETILQMLGKEGEEKTFVYIRKVLKEEKKKLRKRHRKKDTGMCYTVSQSRCAGEKKR